MAKRMNMVALVAVVAMIVQCSVAQTVHVVGSDIGWRIPPGGSAAYATWAASQNFTVGDILEFEFTGSSHDVAQVTREAFLSCNTTIPTISLITIGPANITLENAGEHYFICTFDGHCDAGQKLAINVTEASAASPPAPTPPKTPTPKSAPAPAPIKTPTPKSAPAPAPIKTPAPKSAPAPIETPAPNFEPTPAPCRSPVNYTVGDGIGWTIPGDAVVYQTWASNKTFMVGDTLVFNFAKDAHDVAEVTKTAYATCDSNTTIATYTMNPTMITLNTSGEHFFICTFPGHCTAGQKLAINVTDTTTATPPTTAATPPSTAATPPSTTATPPSTTATPPSTTATPPPPTSTTASSPTDSSAPSLTAAAGFTATFLSIAVAYLVY